MLQDYKKFWESFGKFMKLGCIEDTGNHKRLAPLLRFYSSKNETDLISLDQYVENMPETQKAIYYIATDSLQSAKTAPFLEKLVQKDIEVCKLIDRELRAVNSSSIALTLNAGCFCYLGSLPCRANR